MAWPFLLMRKDVAFYLNKLANNDDRPKNWKCCELYKTLTNQEIDKILTIKKVYERPLEEIWTFLHEIDAGCQHTHYTKVVQSENHGECIKEEREFMGHPIQCTTGNCESPLWLL